MARSIEPSALPPFVLVRAEACQGTFMRTMFSAGDMSTFDNTGCSRVDASAPDNRDRRGRVDSDGLHKHTDRH